MAGVLQLFAANKASYRLTEDISSMQESARFAMSQLEHDIRMAGFTGCTGRNQDNILIQPQFTLPNTFTAGNGIEGWEAAGTAYGGYSVLADDAAVSDASDSGWSTVGGVILDDDTNALSSSDVVRLWHVDGNGVLVNVSGGSVDAGKDPPYEANDTLMLTDCSRVDIVRVCSVDSDFDASLNCSPNTPLNLLNDSGVAVAYKLAGWVYYIGKRATDPDYPDVPPALFRREISLNSTAGNPQELVQGVEALQLQYGIDTSTVPDGVADAYVDADNVNDWNNVVSLRVHLLMQSFREDLVDGSQTFNFNGAAVTANDGRLRFPFVATVSLRNRSR
jgi:type IV pilus assembly protein PilW